MKNSLKKNFKIATLLILTAAFIGNMTAFAGGKGRYGKGVFSKHLIFDALEDTNPTDEQIAQIKNLFEKQKAERKEKKSDKKENRQARQAVLKEIILKNSLTNEDLDQFFLSREKGGFMKDRHQGHAKLLAGIHQILTPEQRQKFKESAIKEIDEKAEGSFFKKMFHSSPQERIQKKLTKSLDLTDSQQELLAAALPSEENKGDIRKQMFAATKKVIEKFDDENFTEETVTQTLTQEHEALKALHMKRVKAVYPQLISFHSSLSQEQKQKAVELLEKHKERKKRKH